ncbi:FecR family protein [Methylomonas methanica]|uniref:Iron dicitrate transport regulator FecR n=1 Tax=Methylomonas methanica TaxID=421 RepID=A0A177M9B4_METMH|nr:FecR family protein [Methylomonas methanica]OAI01590.1 iron dicitrate transport regulator FecR [Methylomonas methanica]
MSDNPQSASSGSLSDQALAWFARMHADDVSDEERRQFEIWYHADPRHAEAYDKSLKLWDLLQLPAERVQQRLQADAAQFKTAPSPAGTTAWMQEVGQRLEQLPRGQGEGRLQPSSGGRSLHRAAMGCLGLLLLVAGWRLPEQWQNWRSDYHTAAGQQLSVDLADGSRLTLNTDTALVVRYSDSLRHIELLRGEAYFEVAPNKQRPFVVDGGQATARAVGTAYSVRKHADEMRIVVSEGTVEVDADNAKALVHAAEQAEYRQGRLQAVAKLDNDDALAWRRSQTVFHRQPLTQVLEEVNRYRRGRIVAVNPQLAERVVNGVFNNGDPDAVLAALVTTLQAKALRMPGDLVLLY